MTKHQEYQSNLEGLFTVCRHVSFGVRRPVALVNQEQCEKVVRKDAALLGPILLPIARGFWEALRSHGHGGSHSECGL